MKWDGDTTLFCGPHRSDIAINLRPPHDDFVKGVHTSLPVIFQME